VESEWVGNAVSRPQTITISTNGLTWFDWQMIGACILLFPLAFAMIYFLAIGGAPGGIIGALIAAAVICAVTFLLAEAIVSVRSIDINPSGMSFHYLFNTEQGSWEVLRPGPYPPKRGEWYVMRPRMTRSGPALRGHKLTLEQARAVVHYPSCPKWELDPLTAAALGLAHAADLESGG